jgi:acyl-CoA dehydrogenase
MQISPIPTLDDETNQLRSLTADIVANQVIPNEHFLRQRDQRGVKEWARLINLVKEAGLWAPHLPEEYGGMGIGFLKHAYMNEILAWSPYSNPIFGVLAPNSGNQKILIKYGTPEQKKRWLEPLVAGTLQSCFAMTEPNAAGSDPRAIQTRAVREGDEWVISGHKWYVSNARAAHFAIVMCRTEEPDGSGGINDKMTQIIVPTDTPGYEIVRDVPVWGHRRGHHGEIILDGVRVPLENQLGQEGSGHRAAQDRLGAGRVFHCMNSVGQMWRAFDMMVRRAMEREVHGGMLETKQFVQGFIADSYMDIQASRLMTIHCAEVMESGGDARTEISSIKVFVPAAMHRVVDRAIQVHGALGVSSDTPLEGMYRGARVLRLADGPDEVHRILIAKNILKTYRSGESWDFGI